MWVLRLGALAALLAAREATAFLTGLPGDASTHHRDVETSHSLHHPFDATSTYWSFGGSTVLTDKLVSLTPSAQSRRGWLWNDYPLQSQSWEVEIGVRVKGQPSLGGDGFGIWFLDSSQDPNASPTSSQNLMGNLFGVQPSFKGFGVVVDTYDNDARRDNPTVMVLANQMGGMRSWNHENDLRDDRVPKFDVLPIPNACTFEVRNANDPIMMIVRYQDDALHVYTDTLSEAARREARQKHTSPYLLCLSVPVTLAKGANLHLAFTAMTGDVADRHDILSVHTRYLDETDARIDDEALRHAPKRRTKFTWGNVFWKLGVILVTGACVLANGYEIHYFLKLKQGSVNAVYMCQSVNKILLPHWAAHAVLFVLLWTGGRYFLVLLNLPFVLYRGFRLATGGWKVEPAKLQFNAGMQTNVRMGALAVYLLTGLVFVISLAFQ